MKRFDGEVVFLQTKHDVSLIGYTKVYKINSHRNSRLGFTLVQVFVLEAAQRAVRSRVPGAFPHAPVPILRAVEPA